jgi:hypothetical protein
MMPLTSPDAGPRGVAIENDFLSTLQVMGSRYCNWNPRGIALGRFPNAWALIETDPA